VGSIKIVAIAFLPSLAVPIRLFNLFYIVTNHTKKNSMNEEKVARICWNTNNWQFPSGRAGKVANAKTNAYEAKTGYGHEEWLFNINKLVNGFHYAYIQAIGQHRNKYESEIFDIAFYTIESTKKQRWWLGDILNVQVVSEEESKAVYAQYKKNGWLTEMYAQLESVGADLNEFKGIEPEVFFCVKFKPGNMNLLEEPRPFDQSDPAVRSDYYNLKNKVGNPAGLETQGFVFSPGGRGKKSKTTATYRGQTKDIDLIHNQIQEQMFAQLNKTHGEGNVACEHATGHGTQIDLVVNSGSGLTFYELKTANTAKQCIREALSQLLEYSLYPSEERASKLVVIAPAELTHDSSLYLEKLRSRFSIPIFYQWYDLETKILGREQ
jgi:hypothetical protein